MFSKPAEAIIKYSKSHPADLVMPLIRLTTRLVLTMSQLSFLHMEGKRVSFYARKEKLYIYQINLVRGMSSNIKHVKMRHRNSQAYITNPTINT